MDVCMDTIRNNDQQIAPLSSDWYVCIFNPIGLYSGSLCSCRDGYCLFRLLLENLHLKLQWYLLHFLSVSYRQQKEEDEELERILQLSLTEK